MSDDLFLREVDEEVRQERMKALWRRFGPIIIGLAILIVVGVGGWRGYEYWTESRANDSGDRFLTALNQAGDGNTDAAIETLAALEADGYGSYPLLAQMRIASETAKTDPEAAIAGFIAIANASGVADPVRDLARLRAAYLLVDHGSRDDVSRHAEPLTGAANPWRFSALEALGLAAHKAGDMQAAFDLFNQIVSDSAAPGALRQRATVMVELLRGAGIGQDS